MEKQIILFTDGSECSEKAADLAVELANLYKIKLSAFYIIDSGWGSLLGDEWINTSETRMRFFNWFEGELKTHAAESLKKVEKAALSKEVRVKTQILIGPAERLIIDCAGERPTAYVVLPNPNATAPGAAGGLKYNVGALAKKINCPILVGPK
ncbi:MAG: universal stress protein, partial [Firmicutes bacterium]|nr:universal stress protein [Bacillota bacterium]